MRIARWFLPLIMLLPASCECDANLSQLSSVLVPNRTEVRFDDTYLGGLDQENIVFKNVGSAALSLDKIEIKSKNDDQFGSDALPSGTLLQPGKSIELELRFVPTIASESESSFFLESGGDKLEIPLFGTGIPQLACDESNPCLTESFDPSTGECLRTIHSGTDCAESNLCAVEATCVEGACIVQELVDCSSVVNNFCDHGVCDPMDGSCRAEENPLACDDGEICTLDFCNREVEACDWAAVADNTQCGAQEGCDVLPLCKDAVCTDFPVPDGNSCIDGDFCTIEDTCLAGECNGTRSELPPQRVGTAKYFAHGFTETESDDYGSVEIMGERVLFIDHDALGTYATLTDAVFNQLDPVFGPEKIADNRYFTQVQRISDTYFLMLDGTFFRLFEITSAGLVVPRGEGELVTTAATGNMALIGTHVYYCGVDGSLLAIDIADVDAPVAIGLILGEDTCLDLFATADGRLANFIEGFAVNFWSLESPVSTVYDSQIVESFTAFSLNSQFAVGETLNSYSVNIYDGVTFAFIESIPMQSSFLLAGQTLLTEPFEVFDDVVVWSLSNTDSATRLGTVPDLSLWNHSFRNGLLIDSNDWFGFGSSQRGVGSARVYRLNLEGNLNIVELRHEAQGAATNLVLANNSLYTYSLWSIQNLDIAPPQSMRFVSGSPLDGFNGDYHQSHWALGVGGGAPYVQSRSGTYAYQSALTFQDAASPNNLGAERTLRLPPWFSLLDLQYNGAVLTRDNLYFRFGIMGNETQGPPYNVNPTFNFIIVDLDNAVYETAPGGQWTEPIHDLSLEDYLVWDNVNEWRDLAIAISDDLSLVFLTFREGAEKYIILIELGEDLAPQVLFADEWFGGTFTREEPRFFVSGDRLLTEDTRGNAGEIPTTTYHLFEFSLASEQVTELAVVEHMGAAPLLAFDGNNVLAGYGGEAIFYDVSDGEFVDVGSLPMHDTPFAAVIGSDEVVYTLNQSAVEAIYPPCPPLPEESP